MTIKRYACKRTGRQTWCNNMWEAETSMCWKCPFNETCDGLDCIETDDIWSELMGGSNYEQRTESVGDR